MTDEAMDTPPQPIRTILVVDDNHDIRRLLRLALGGAYDVLEADDGDKGLELVRKHSPDLVILDIMMPGTLDGLQVLEVIKTSPELKHIPVAMLTARGQANDCEFGLGKGADAYFVKPFSPLKLLQWVKETLG